MKINDKHYIDCIVPPIHAEPLLPSRRMCVCVCVLCRALWAGQVGGWLQRRTMQKHMMEQLAVTYTSRRHRGDSPCKNI